MNKGESLRECVFEFSVLGINFCCLCIFIFNLATALFTLLILN